MAVLTPSSTTTFISGHKVHIIGTFTAINDTDTWEPGMTTVDGAWVTNGANDVDTGATFSGGTITVQCAGAMANAKILAIGI